MRRPLRLPIILATLMIILLVALLMGWILLAVYGLLEDNKRAVMYITLLSVGTASLLLMLAGTIMYLILTVKTINLQQRQSNFIDSVTHELKSPLASLKLYVQTLVRRRVAEGERQHFYEFMLADVERLDHLINHLLDAARLDRGPGETELETLSLASLVSSVADSVRARYRVPVEVVELDLEPIWIQARRVDLEMIVRNLMDNAVKYAGDPPAVSVTLDHTPRGEPRLRFRDNGSGIPYHLRRKIFSRFVRLGSELRREKPGTGLGLFIVKNLVQRLKGKVHVQDVEDGPGSVFEVILPLGILAPAPNEFVASDALSDAARGTPRISIES